MELLELTRQLYEHGVYEVTIVKMGHALYHAYDLQECEELLKQDEHVHIHEVYEDSFVRRGHEVDQYDGPKACGVSLV